MCLSELNSGPRTFLKWCQSLSAQLLQRPVAFLGVAVPQTARTPTAAHCRAHGSRTVQNLPGMQACFCRHSWETGGCLSFSDTKQRATSHKPVHNDHKAAYYGYKSTYWLRRQGKGFLFLTHVFLVLCIPSPSVSVCIMCTWSSCLRVPPSCVQQPDSDIVPGLETGQ